MTKTTSTSTNCFTDFSWTPASDVTGATLKTYYESRNKELNDGKTLIKEKKYERCGTNFIKMKGSTVLLLHLHGSCS